MSHAKSQTNCTTAQLLAEFRSVPSVVALSSTSCDGFRGRPTEAVFLEFIAKCLAFFLHSFASCALIRVVANTSGQFTKSKRLYTICRRTVYLHSYPSVRRCVFFFLRCSFVWSCMYLCLRLPVAPRHRCKTSMLNVGAYVLLGVFTFQCATSQ